MAAADHYRPIKLASEELFASKGKGIYSENSATESLSKESYERILQNREFMFTLFKSRADHFVFAEHQA